MDSMTSHTNQDVEAAIVSKIEALFRQANHPNTGEAERQAFHAKALALMEKHRILQVNLDLETDEEPADHEFGWCKGLYTKSHQAIVSAVAKIYGCGIYYNSSGRPGDPARRVWIFGFKRDAERVKHLAAEFIADAMSQAAQYKSPPGYGASDRTTNWRKSFMLGYASEIGKRYDEAKRLLDQEQPGWSTTGNALVLVSRSQQVSEAFAAKKDLRRVSSRTQGLNGSGFAAGQEAGRNSNVGRARVGSGQSRALGSGS